MLFHGKNSRERKWSNVFCFFFFNFLRHCNSTEIGVKEDALELLVQGWNLIGFSYKQLIFFLTDDK